MVTIVVREPLVTQGFCRVLVSFGELGLNLLAYDALAVCATRFANDFGRADAGLLLNGGIVELAVRVGFLTQSGAEPDANAFAAAPVAFETELAEVFLPVSAVTSLAVGTSFAVALAARHGLFAFGDPFERGVESFHLLKVLLEPGELIAKALERFGGRFGIAFVQTLRGLTKLGRHF
jgi:hypothetical protein